MLLNTLYYLYKNRWRHLSYKDASSGWIFLIVYALALWAISRNTNERAASATFLLLILQVNYFHSDRKDYNLLLRFFGTARTQLVLFSDYFILSIPLLLVIFLKNKIFVLPAIGAIAAFALLRKISFQKRGFIRLPISVADPLWKTYLRKYPLAFVLLLFGYYVCLQGVLNENFELATTSCFMVALVGWSVNCERDKLIFIQLSKFSARKYLLNIIQINVFNTLLFLLPYFFINLHALYFVFWTAFQIIAFMVVAVNFRYIIFRNLLIYLFAMLPIFALSISNALDIFSASIGSNFLMATGSLFVAALIFLWAEKAIGKLKITAINS